MSLAEDSPILKSKLFAGAQLTSAGVASEAGQVVNVLPCSTNPVRRRDGSATSGALGSKRPIIIINENAISLHHPFQDINCRDLVRSFIYTLSVKYHKIIGLNQHRNGRRGKNNKQQTVFYILNIMMNKVPINF